MEDIQRSIRTCFRKYADFSGRAALPEFWWFFAFQLAIYLVAGMVSGWLYGVAFAALLLPSLAVGARRLHDTGRSGWFLLIGLIPVAGLVILWFLAQPGQAGGNTHGPAAAAMPS